MELFRNTWIKKLDIGDLKLMGASEAATDIYAATDTVTYWMDEQSQTVYEFQSSNGKICESNFTGCWSKADFITWFNGIQNDDCVTASDMEEAIAKKNLRYVMEDGRTSVFWAGNTYPYERRSDDDIVLMDEDKCGFICNIKLFDEFFEPVQKN